MPDHQSHNPLDVSDDRQRLPLPLGQHLGKVQSGCGVVENDCLSGIDEQESRLSHQTLLCLMLANPVVRVRLDQAGRDGSRKTAGLSRQPLRFEGIKISMQRHRAYSKDFRKILDPHRSGAKHKLHNGVVAVNLAQVVLRRKVVGIGPRSRDSLIGTGNHVTGLVPSLHV